MMPSRRSLGALSLMAAAGLLAAFPKLDPPLLLINESPSVPQGVYIRDSSAAIRGGSLALVAPPAATRRYLASLGTPPDLRLLKRVAAAGGQPVCARDGLLRSPLASVSVPSHDRRGEALPVWEGCRHLDADEVLLLGDSANSFDSRHFGPVRRADIEATYREVLTW